MTDSGQYTFNKIDMDDKLAGDEPIDEEKLLQEKYHEWASKLEDALNSVKYCKEKVKFYEKAIKSYNKAFKK